MSNGKSLTAWLLVSAMVLGLLLACTTAAAARDEWTFTWDWRYPGVENDLYGVEALDALHVWAVGTGGMILFYDGSGWTVQGAGTTMETLYDVSALDADHVWAVGGRGTVLFFDGATWSAQASGTTRALYGVHALNPNHVWAVGGGGTVRHFNGTAWGEQASGTGETLNAVTAVDATHAWAVGKDVRLRYDGANWNADGPTTNNYNSVSALDANRVWASAENARISFYDGVGWLDRATPADIAGESITGISAADPTDVWACTDGGAVVFDDGTGWEMDGRIYWDSLLDISAAGDSEVWAVGASGGVFQGHKFVPPTTPRDWATESRAIVGASNNWYLPEGSTGPGFTTFIELSNPTGGDAHVTVMFMTDDETIPVPAFDMIAQSRTTLNVADWAPGEWGVSTRVNSSVPINAERTMYDVNQVWGHNSFGVSMPRADWYLAEGSTGPGFETWILIQNAGAFDAHVLLTYMTPLGPVDGPAVTMAPNTRRTFNVADTLPDEWSVSTMVHSDHEVIAERSMYGSGRTWAHDCVAVSAPSANWYLAEGCTGPGFETWILVQNPNAEEAEVELTYQTTAGRIDGPNVILEPNSRQTFNVADTIETWSVSTEVAANRPVIAERAMYGNGRTWAHDSTGATAAVGGFWCLAEGGTSSNTETWLLVQNPTGAGADVTFHFTTQTGPGPVVTVHVPANTRQTFNAGDYIANRDFGVWAAPTAPIILERAMYGGCST